MPNCNILGKLIFSRGLMSMGSCSFLLLSLLSWERGGDVDMGAFFEG